MRESKGGRWVWTQATGCFILARSRLHAHPIASVLHFMIARPDHSRLDFAPCAPLLGRDQQGTTSRAVQQGAVDALRPVAGRRRSSGRLSPSVVSMSPPVGPHASEVKFDITNTNSPQGERQWGDHLGESQAVVSGRRLWYDRESAFRTMYAPNCGAQRVIQYVPVAGRRRASRDRLNPMRM